ncbi:unnamed protein product [Diamesa serratosioi]
MKVFSIILLVVAVSMVTANREGTKEGLFRAQNELSIGHNFAETTLAINRNVISSYIAIVTSSVLDSFMDSYSEIKQIGDETHSTLFNGTTAPSVCHNRIISRWELQISRFGQKLSECMLETVLQMEEWNSWVNNGHTVAQRTYNQVQNLGMNVLSQLNNFLDEEDIPRLINRQFRDLLSSARPYNTMFEEFRQNVVANEDNLINQLTSCDRRLVSAFANEARADIESFNRCI